MAQETFKGARGNAHEGEKSFWGIGGVVRHGGILGVVWNFFFCGPVRGPQSGEVEDEDGICTTRR